MGAAPGFSVFIYVSRPAAETYEAVADPAQLTCYFTTGGARGRLETGATVTWDFADFPGAFRVRVIEATPNASITIAWRAREDGPADYDTSVHFGFEPVEDGARTKVTVSESGWRDNDAARAASYGNCMGWSQMLAALKVWLEHGINLRDGAYR